MKKMITTLFFSLVCIKAYSLPLGNPSEPSLYCNGVFTSNYCCDPCDPCFNWCDAWSFRVGFYGDYVENRNLRIDGNGLGRGHVIQKTVMRTDAAYLALNICNLIDVFTTLGASNLAITGNELSWVFNGSAEGNVYTDTRFSWSIGSRATLLTYNCLSLGIEGQYFQTDLDITRYRSIFRLLNYFNDNNHTCYHEWQIGLGLSYAFKTRCPNIAVVPYTGFKYSRAYYNTHNFTFLRAQSTNEFFTIFNMKSNKHWGYALGVTLTMCDLIGFTLEGRWGDERAFYINGQIRF